MRDVAFRRHPWRDSIAPDARAAAERDLILKMDDSERITPEVCSPLETLWKDEGVKQCFQHQHLFQLNDSTQYYMGKDLGDRGRSVSPSEQDVLRSACVWDH